MLSNGRKGPFYGRRGLPLATLSVVFHPTLPFDWTQQPKHTAKARITSRVSQTLPPSGLYSHQNTLMTERPRDAPYLIN